MYNTRFEVDIHGLSYTEAKFTLERIIAKADTKTKEIVVIHGYKQGNSLKNMVRKSLKNKKIKQKIIGLNQGETILILH